MTLQANVDPLSMVGYHRGDACVLDTDGKKVTWNIGLIGYCVIKFSFSEKVVRIVYSESRYWYAKTRCTKFRSIFIRGGYFRVQG